MSKIFKYTVSVFGLLGLMMSFQLAAPSYVHAQESGECLFPDRAIKIYGQRVCPDKFNKDDDFAQWAELTESLPELLPGSFMDDEKDKTPAELCDHVKALLARYGGDAEVLMGYLGGSLTRMAQNDAETKAYVDQFEDQQVQPENIGDTAVINTMLSGDTQKFNELLAQFSPELQGKVLMVKFMVDKARLLTVLHDSALDTCSAYAQEKGYYKIMNYNGPDADYDPEKDPGWAELRKKWDAERKAQGLKPLSEINSNPPAAE